MERNITLGATQLGSFVAGFLRDAGYLPTLHVIEIGARIVDAGRGSGPAEPFHTLAGAKVIAFDPDARACEEINGFSDHFAAEIHAWPYALGGHCGKQLLYETRHPMSSSLYPPNEALLRHYVDLEVMYPSERYEIDVITLDAFMEREGMEDVDFIKADVHGSELDIFGAATKAMPQLVGVCIEVMWAPLYKSQPLFGEVDTFLRSYGLQMHHFFGMGGRHIKNTVIHGEAQALWSDAIYFPDMDTVEVLPGEKLLKLAVMAGMYNALDLAQHALRRHDEVTGSALLPGFVEAFVERFMNNGQAVPQEQSTGTALQTEGPRRLHIGGREAHPDWEVMDALPGEHVDHVGNAADLSRFADGTFDALYASHVLEHFGYQQELPQVLREWQRVLAPGGTLYISVPDLEALCSLFTSGDLSPDDRFMAMRMIFGGQTTDYDFHKAGYDEGILRGFLTEAGFVDIRKVENFDLFQDTSTMAFHGKPVSLNMVARKPYSHDEH